jgi:hypothetical protein
VPATSFVGSVTRATTVFVRQTGPPLLCVCSVQDASEVHAPSCLHAAMPPCRAGCRTRLARPHRSGSGRGLRILSARPLPCAGRWYRRATCSGVNNYETHIDNDICFIRPCIRAVGLMRVMRRREAPDAPIARFRLSFAFRNRIRFRYAGRPARRACGAAVAPDRGSRAATTRGAKTELRSCKLARTISGPIQSLDSCVSCRNKPTTLKRRSEECTRSRMREIALNSNSPHNPHRMGCRTVCLRPGCSASSVLSVAT